MSDMSFSRFGQKLPTMNFTDPGVGRLPGSGSNSWMDTSSPSYGLPPSRDVSRPPDYQATVDSFRPSSALDGMSSAMSTATDPSSYKSINAPSGLEKALGALGGIGGKGGAAGAEIKLPEILMPTMQAIAARAPGQVQNYAVGGMARDALSQAMALILSQIQQQGAPPPQRAAQGMFVQGDGDGVSDDIDARLSVGEYVIPADVVSGAGKGSSEAGAAFFDQIVQSIRAQHSDHINNMPPPR